MIYGERALLFESYNKIKKDNSGNYILGKIKGVDIVASKNISEEDIKFVIDNFKKDSKIIEKEFDTILDVIADVVVDYAKNCYSDKSIDGNPKYKNCCEKFMDKKYCKSHISLIGGYQIDDGEYLLTFDTELTARDGHIINLGALSINQNNKSISPIRKDNIAIYG